MFPSFRVPCLSVLSAQHGLAHKYCCWHFDMMAESNPSKEWEVLFRVNPVWVFLLVCICLFGWIFVVVWLGDCFLIIIFICCCYQHEPPGQVCKVKAITDCLFSVNFRSYQLRLYLCIAISGPESSRRIFCVWS